MTRFLCIPRLLGVGLLALAAVTSGQAQGDVQKQLAGARVTIVSPAAVEPEHKFGSTDAESAAGVKAFYEANQIPADSVARAVVYAVEQPADVDINEVVLRPVSQEF